MGSPLIEPKTQSQMLVEFLPIIRESPVYQKFGEVTFYYPEPGMVIETIIDGNLETTNTSKKGDMGIVGP